MKNILSIRGLSKVYRSGERDLTVLHDISVDIDAGTACSIVGPSGSGKTTFLGLCAGLDVASSGSVTLNGVQLDKLSEDERARVRNEMTGFVFQNFQLMPTLTATENVMVPLELRGEKNVRSRALKLLEDVGLGDRAHHYPVQLSGGEQQRVAFARAFINQPKILFADEPTGNLDSETSDRIEQLLFELNKAHGTTLVMATHDMELANMTDRVLKFKGGRLVSDEVLEQGKKAVSA